MGLQNTKGVGRRPHVFNEPTKTFTVRVPVSVLRSLKYMAADEFRTVSEIMREQAETLVTKKYGS